MVILTGFTNPVNVKGLDDSVPAVGADRCWENLNITGRDVKVGIIDTGIDWKIPDFYKPDGGTYDLKTHEQQYYVDINDDGIVDARDEYFDDMRSISYRDDNKDGIMDRSWTTFYSDKGVNLYVEYDLNNDGLIDSKFKLNRGVRENLVNGVWMKDVERDNKHGVVVDGQWRETVFENGMWKYYEKFVNS